MNERLMQSNARLDAMGVDIHTIRDVTDGETEQRVAGNARANAIQADLRAIRTNSNAVHQQRTTISNINTQIRDLDEKVDGRLGSIQNSMQGLRLLSQNELDRLEKSNQESIRQVRQIIEETSQPSEAALNQMVTCIKPSRLSIMLTT